LPCLRESNGIARFNGALTCPRAYNAAVLSPSARGLIKAEIDRLEEARKQCNDTRIQKVIEGWIEEQKKQLAEGTAKDS
jgi:hypothetical protein